MLTRFLPVDTKTLRLLDNRFATVRANVPHKGLITHADLMDSQLGVSRGRAARMYERHLIANKLPHQCIDKRELGLQFRLLIRVLVRHQKTAGHAITVRILAADKQEAEIADELAQRHIPRRSGISHH